MDAQQEQHNESKTNGEDDAAAAARRRGFGRSSSRISVRSGQQVDAGANVGNQTLMQMFLSGANAGGGSRTGSGEFPGSEEPGNTDVCDVDFFPDPPCIAPFDEGDEEKRPEKPVNSASALSYFKGHATWKTDDPEISMARLRAQSFVDLWTQKNGDGKTGSNGRLAKVSAAANLRSIGELSVCEAFVNISPHSVGVRSTNSLDQKHKTGEAIRSGQSVVVDKVVEVDGIRFLRLADGRGWVFDSDGKHVAMAKLEEVETGASWYRVVAKKLVEVRHAPVPSDEARSGRLLCPKEVAVVNIRGRVRGQTYVHLADGRGWVFAVQLPSSSAGQQRSQARSGEGEAVMEECDAEITMGLDDAALTVLPPTNDAVDVGLWTYVVGLDPVLAVGTKLNGTYIEPGDFIKIDKRAYADGMPPSSGGFGQRWLRLLDGRGWVPETSIDGKVLLTLRTEPMISYPSHFKGVKNMDRPSAPWMVGIA